MKSKKNTRSALFMSVISLVLCCAMLMGTTFAWFTDEVTSGVNQINAGNLDIELDYYDTAAKDWKSVAGAQALFSENLWEPGHTEVVYLRLSNKGSLALKYRLGINVASETEGTNVAGNTFKLSDHIYMGVVEKAEPSYTTREEAIAAAQNGVKGIIGNGYTKPGSMQAKDADIYMAVVVYMPETVGNEANYKTGTTAPVINLGINLFATQLESELDSFGPDYDKGAAWTGDVDTEWYFADPDATEFTIESGEELAGFAALVNGTATAPVTTLDAEGDSVVQDTFAGKTVKLGANINLNDSLWTPIGRNSADFAHAFKGTFDGQDYIISNLNVSNEGWAGVFGIAHEATIKNLVVDGATIHSNRMAGTIVGQLYGNIDNCHVNDANIIVIPNAVGDTYDNGDKVGGIVGWIGENNENRSLTNCSVQNSSLGAYRDIGGIVGYAASGTSISGNSVSGISITVDQTTNNYGEKDTNAGAILGRDGGAAASGNNENEVSFSVTYLKNGLTLQSSPDSNAVTMYRVPADYEGTTVSVPEGVTNIGGYAFAYNSGIDEITLPSTVTTLNDRAFRDTSASIVVLNEGLTNISYQAFRNALNVTSVEIPSTVTTISKEAFQYSGIEELKIPANVTTIENGGCRDMKELETVIIEGNVDIPVYAFRACTNLRTVILKGDDVTFGGGSRGMIFTNKENGDGSAITIYVANETVKERLLAADTAATDYGGYKIVVGDASTEVVNSAEVLKDVLTNAGEAGAGNTVINIKADMDLTDQDWTPINVDGYNGADIVTIDGQGHTITGLDAPLFAGGFAGGSGIVIKNLTIADSNIVSENGQGSGAFIECVDSMDVITLENCHLKNSTVSGSRTGGLIGWTSGYSNVNDGAVKTYITIKNCSVVGCTVTGSSVGGINGHAGASDWTYTTIENCEVTNCNLNSTDDGDWRVGVVVGTANAGEVTISNITESGNTLTQTGKTAPAGQSNLYGRFVPGTTGKLTIDGVAIN